MSEESKTSGQDTDSSGKGETVAYESFHKVLTEKKSFQKRLDETTKELEALRSKLDEYSSKESELERKKLEEQGNFKILLDQREKELKKLEEEKTSYANQVEEFKKSFTDMKKLNSFFDKIGGKLKDKEYMDLVKPEKIAIDPESGEIDQKSLDAYAQEFLKKHSALVAFKDKARLPNEAGTTSKNMSYEEWTKLAQTNPKEARKTMHLIMK